MDETNPSRTSDAATAATRKRRSSILKSQRPPRTPFSELEFHIATPTDTAKSRRVSFSRRTGVAEFVTNEATTTWKNFYEEQNKSLESSGNESGANVPKPTIGHLGKRIFDQQFQEIEAVDFITSLDNHSSKNVNNSLNNVNFTQQLAALECTGGDRNLSIQQQNFEMSAFTDHQSKVFGDDFALPTMGEMSGRIDVNFSAVQCIGTGEVKDDLDEIQADLQRVKSNVLCPGPFNGRRDLSEYIEVDLNCTHAVIKNDASDMSITDTIVSPKVQEVAKSSSLNINKKASFNKDCIEDKENIAVYEGCRSPTPERRKTIVYENDTGNISITQALPMNILLPDEHKSSERRKTIVYETDSADISVTQAVPVNIMIVNKDSEKRKTIIYENDTGNISVTQAIPSNLILQENSRTIISEDDLGNISITTGISMAKIVSSRSSQASNKSVVKEEPKLDLTVDTHKRKTLVENEGDIYNMSMTKTIETKHLLGEASHESITNKQFNMSSVINHSVPRSVHKDVSEYPPTMTQSNNATINIDNRHISQIKNLTITDDKMLASFNKPESKNSQFKIDTSMDISQEQLLTQEVYEKSDKMKSNEDSGRNSEKGGINVHKDWVADKENVAGHEGSKSSTKDRRRTIVYENDTGNISITQAIPMNIMLPNENKTTDKRKTIVFDTDAADLSVTQTVPLNIMILNKNNEKRKTIIYENETNDISVTQAIPSNLILPEISKAIDAEHDLSDVSFTQAIPVAKIISMNNSEGIHKSFLVEDQKMDVVAKEECSSPVPYDHKTDLSSMSITKPIETKYLLSEALEKSITNNQLNMSTGASMSITKPIETKYLLSEALEKSITNNQLNMSTGASMSITKPIETKYLLSEALEKSIANNQLNMSTGASMSITKPIETKYLLSEALEKSIANNQLNMSTGASMSITKPIETKYLLSEALEKSIANNQLNMSTGASMSITKPIETKYLLSEALEKSIANNQLNMSTGVELELNQSISKTTPQDVFVYQAAISHSELVKEDCDWRDPEMRVAISSEVTDKTSLATFAESESKESMLEVNTSMQISQAQLLKYMCEENKILSNQKVDLNVELTDTKLVSNNNTDMKVFEKTRQTILDDLLDMSHTSIDVSTANKSSVSVEEQVAAKADEQNAINDSVHTIQDSEDETTQTDKIDDKSQDNIGFIKGAISLLALQYKEPEGSEESVDVSKKPSELDKDVVDDKRSPKNRRFEKIRSADLENEKTMNLSRVKERLEMSRGGRSFRDANDTNELLEMLSDLTDKTKVGDDEEKPKDPVRRPSQYAEVNEPRRLSIAPNRLSIVLSREDLLNNISMAQAALQRSIEIDESIADTSITLTEDISPPKPSRLSNEVVKKLHFEDESASDTSVKSDVKTSPLKKTAFGETAYMKESKSKVIPSYLKGVSEEIKSLMDDLVKPNADATPFLAVKAGLMRDPSTCSMHIQANLITSSQIDIDNNINSGTTSTCDLGKLSSPSFCTEKFFIGSEIEKPLEEPVMTHIPTRTVPNRAMPDRVIFFDHENPLNNILLMPPIDSNVHKYNPKSSTTLCAKASEPVNSENAPSIEKSPEKVTNEYNVGNVTVSRTIRHAGDSEKILDKERDASITNISTSVHESVRVYELKDTKVNTIIAMKANKELLETSSSLTLVDDALAANAFDVGLESAHSKSTPNTVVKLIYHNDENCGENAENKDSDLTNVEMGEPVNMSKGKKRIYSPAVRNKHRGLSSADVTPKQMSKLQKISDSPKSVERLEAEKDVPQDEAIMDVEESVNIKDVTNNEKKSPQKTNSRSKKPGTDITVQQLITEYDLKANIDQDTLNRQILEALSRSGSSTAPETASNTDVENKSPEIVSSFTSSKNQNEMRKACSVTTTESVASTQSLRLDWQPDEVTSKSAMSECESSVNVVAKIDMLPFMGSHECEWESSGTDTWSFRLLYARLRLTVRLAHRHDNATRTRVRADTPVLAVALEIAHADKKNTIAALCVSFAAEAMRHCIAHGSSRAAAVPALLRRCAGVARVALRWGRAMHDARLRLAYTLRPDGALALKVANIPLRSVWEVTMRLEMGGQDERQPPCPRATDVKVARVVSDVKISDDEVERVLSQLPKDWGHVPRAVWKIFRYLKNKTRDTELLGL